MTVTEMATRIKALELSLLKACDLLEDTGIYPTKWNHLTKVFRSLVKDV